MADQIEDGGNDEDKGRDQGPAIALSFIFGRKRLAQTSEKIGYAHAGSIT